MKDTWVEPESGIWVVEGRSPRIEYSQKAIEEVCNLALSGLQKLSRGGIEVGGVLYGRHEDGVVHIRTWRQIACEHSRGPAFLLSPSDTSRLEALLRESGPTLEGLRPVGWFVSHTRSEINLRDEDQAIFDRYFPEPWQVTLVLRPARHRGTDAGFFFREPDGALQTESSYKPFSVAAFARFSSRHEARPDVRPRRLPLAVKRPFPLEQSMPESAAEAPQPVPARSSSRLALLLWAVLAIGLIGAGAYYFLRAGQPADLVFRAADSDGQMRLEWDHSSPWLRNADYGELEINDGGDKTTHRLTPEFLRQGNFVYVRKSDDVDSRLTVYKNGRASTSGSARFLGEPDNRTFTTEINYLRSEQKRLEAANAAETARKIAVRKKYEEERSRNRRLQQQLRILEQQVRSLRSQPGSR